MCKYNATTQTAAGYVRGYETLPHNDYEAVMNHLGNVGPLSIAVDASSWSGYEGGVFDGCPYEKNIEINHGVQVTNKQYIKNVWICPSISINSKSRWISFVCALASVYKTLPFCSLLAMDQMRLKANIG